ncbi:MAG: AAA family ATPase [Nocardioides sp.]
MVLINGAPGSGKSTLADALAKALPAAGAIDLDGIKHSLPSWPDDQQGSGLEARHRALAEARTFIDTGYDVVLGQYLARTEFIEQLDQLALETRADFIELCLDIDEHTLADRLASRAVRAVRAVRATPTCRRRATTRPCPRGSARPWHRRPGG